MNAHSTVGGKKWCEQCEALQAPAAAKACRSRFCKLKATLPPELCLGFEKPPGAVTDPPRPPVEVHPAVIEQIKRRPRPPSGKRNQRDENGLTHRERRLLEEMKRRADPDDGTVAVSFNDVFEAIGCTCPSAVSPIMRSLEGFKLVTIVHRPGGRAKTLYLIHGHAKKPPIGPRRRFDDE